MRINFPEFGSVNNNGISPWMRGSEFGMNMLGKGSDLITNALNQQKMMKEMPYAAEAKKAQIASQNTYSNLMGPQYIAKLMSNPQILPNVPDSQKFNILQKLLGQTMGNQEGVGQLNQFQNQQQQDQQQMPQQPSFNPMVSNRIPEYMNQGNQEIQNNPNISNQDREAILNQQPGDSYQIQGNPQQAPQQVQPPMQPQQPQNWSSNVANARGLEKQGEESGKIRAQQMGELDNTVEQAGNTLQTADYISKILTSPVFEKMRQNPLMGHYELNYYEKFGTPEEKQMVGSYKAATSKLIADASSVFKGAFRSGEQQLLEGGKPNENDTVDTAKGKLEAISYLLNFTKERSQMTSDIMDSQHISKSKALREADRLLTGNKIREEIHNKLNPKSSESTRVFYNGKAHMIPKDKVNEALAAGGSLNG